MSKEPIITAKPRIMVVYGTRPEAIKLAPVVKLLRSDSRFQVTVVSTGQHGEMLDDLNAKFELVPDFDLAVMKAGQSLNELMSRVLLQIEEVLQQVSPDCVIVQGDTTTAVTAAVAAFNRRIRVVHLEAGLRTNDLAAPFPEEGNRRMISQVASLHLAPTHSAKNNLEIENVAMGDVVVTGNTVIDSLLQVAEWDVEFEDAELRSIMASDQRVVMMTAHRRENLDVFGNFSNAVIELARLFPETIFVLPLHPNPIVRDIFTPKVEPFPNVLVVDPLPYEQFTALMRRSYLILTDSGGVQEEAPSLGKPVLLMRDNTERPEGVEAGAVELVGTSADSIVAAATGILQHPHLYEKMARTPNPYGDGKAAFRVVAAVAALERIGERMPDFDYSA